MLDTLHTLISKGEDLGDFIGRNSITESQLVDNYGFTLSDLFHYARLNKIINLENLDVLELGGKLSRPFLKQVVKPKSWTSVGTYYDGEPHTTQGIEGPLLDLQPNWNQYCNYSVLAFVKYALGSMHTQSYDLIYSIAAFEHIHKLSTCLQEVSKLLNAGGHLYAYFTSCWMGRHGHHWSRIRNHINEYDHLIYTESEMRSLLTNSGRRASDTDFDLYYIYRGSRINRNTHNDYLRAFTSGDFSARKVTPIGLVKAVDALDANQYARFTQFYPGEEFLCDGYEVLLTK